MGNGSSKIHEIIDTLDMSEMPKMFTLPTFDISDNVQIFMVVLIIIGVIIATYYIITDFNVDNSTDNYKDESKYISQCEYLDEKYASNSKLSLVDLLKTLDETEMPESQRCFVNFYSLGCRYTGYIGPMKEGYWNPEKAVQLAIKAGCRTFILDIDYLDECVENNQYIPRIVVRDIHNRMRIKYNSNINPTTKKLCSSDQTSNIRDVCEQINTYAFSSSYNNNTDPVIIVLYFLRQPSTSSGVPFAYDSKTVLDYYSNVAKSMSCLKDRLLTNELNGGTFYRQKQESILLINKITDYNNKILIFSNANTSGFRDANASYVPHEDLDFLVNLRLKYTSTKLGVTENDAGFGILQTAEDYMLMPNELVNETREQTKLRWTVCLSADPSIPVKKQIYDKITSTFGIHCVPTVLFDDENDFMFSDETFKSYSFKQKPKELRYKKPPIVKAAKQSSECDAKGGNLRDLGEDD